MTAQQPTTRTLDLSAGPVRVRTWEGDGPTVLLVHGLLVDGRLWDAVSPRLAADGMHVVVPDLPLGAHDGPMLADADLSPRGVAQLVDELATTLGLSDVTLVGNDTGGAICQLVAAGQPAWLGGLVLTPCDSHENFLPKFFQPLQLLAAARTGRARRRDAADAPACAAPHAAAAWDGSRSAASPTSSRTPGCVPSSTIRSPVATS